MPNLASPTGFEPVLPPSEGDFPDSETKGLASPPAKFLNSGGRAERTLLAETPSPRNRELCESRSFDLGCDLTG
jgi:hypothetical protein